MSTTGAAKLRVTTFVSLLALMMVGSGRSQSHVVAQGERAKAKQGITDDELTKGLTELDGIVESIGSAGGQLTLKVSARQHEWLAAKVKDMGGNDQVADVVRLRFDPDKVRFETSSGNTFQYSSLKKEAARYRLCCCDGRWEAPDRQSRVTDGLYAVFLCIQEL
jgi:hypothetical protein